MRKIRKVIALALALAALLGLAACGSEKEEIAGTAVESSASPVEAVSSEPEPEVTPEADPEAQEMKFWDCVEYMRINTETAFIDIGNMAQYILNYWNAAEGIGGTLDAEKAVERALEWLAENNGHDRAAVESAHDDIEGACFEFRMIDAPSGYDDLRESVIDMYNAYDDLYDAVLSPGGALKAWANMTNDAMKRMGASCDDVDAWLEHHDR